MASSCPHPGGLELTAQLLQPANLPTGAAILDAGCGAGETVFWLQQQGYLAYGIDKNPSISNQWIVKGVLQQLPYSEGSFAAVISECTAFICGDTREMLRQCWRVLQPGGWLFVGRRLFYGRKAVASFC